jgi:catechol 2,3-dioxygenase-like lactoylglutathione lyase family enzyme
MFSHIMIGTNDVHRAKSFYDKVLGTLGVGEGRIDDNRRVFYMTPNGILAVSQPINGEPATAANGGTIGFACSSTEQADAWHAAGIANGGVTLRGPAGLPRGRHGQDVPGLHA